jgi:predicted TIM-barrel fold metal-dependent hydrolase
LRAIDVHIHVPGPPGSGSSAASEAMNQYFGAQGGRTVEDMAEMYEKDDIFGVIFGGDSAWTAEVIKRYPGRFMGFVYADPKEGQKAVDKVFEGYEKHGLRGLKVHPPGQAFFPNDEKFYPLWQKCSDLKVPVLLHTGQTGVGAGMPGGNGVKLKYGQPIPYIDDMAADFPDLKIIMAHPSVPWQEEQLSVLVHKPNVYMDLSGWSPKYFRPILVQYMNSIVQNKVLFGSDFPVLTPERWFRDFETLDLKPEVRQKILIDNAKKLLNIE